MPNFRAAGHSPLPNMGFHLKHYRRDGGSAWVLITPFGKNGDLPGNNERVLFAETQGAVSRNTSQVYLIVARRKQLSGKS